MEKHEINSLQSTKHSSKDERKYLILQKHCVWHNASQLETFL